jgi:uncharacterized repeat protein (TIGR01451 family)
VLEYSLSGGGSWAPATLAPGDETEDLVASPSGTLHELHWDALADGVLHADNVALRVTVPYQASTRLGGPIQEAGMSSISPPFRVRPPEADLYTTVSNGQDEVLPGETLSYTLSFGNSGQDDVLNVAAAGVFPAELTGVLWTCDDAGGGVCGDPSGAGDIAETVHLPAGAHLSFTATGTVDPGATGPVVVASTVAGPTGMIEVDPVNNSAIDSDPIGDPLIFADGFESGDTSAWTAAMP